MKTPDPNPQKPEDDVSADERHLWDPSAPPDPLIARLEAELAPLRPSRTLDVAALPPRDAGGATGGRVLRLAVFGAALAAAAAAAWLWLSPDERAAPVAEAPAPPANASAAPPIASVPAPDPRAPSFAWSALAGAPDVDGKPAGGAGRLGTGQWLETGADTRVRLDVADIGHVELGADTRLRLVGSAPGEHRLALERGRISAKVDAPPRLFVVETPSATAIDLGCAYELAVDADGSGSLTVTSGAVELAGGARRVLPVLVPRGAECAFDRGRGPGTPVWSRLDGDAKAAVARYDASPTDPAALAAAVATLGDRDSLTLIHLLDGAPPDARAAVVTKLAAIEPLPEGVTRAALVAGSREALARYRSAIEPRWYPGPTGKKAWDRAPEPR